MSKTEMSKAVSQAFVVKGRCHKLQGSASQSSVREHLENDHIRLARWEGLGWGCFDKVDPSAAAPSPAPRVEVSQHT